MGHLSKTPLNLLEIHDIGPVYILESKTTELRSNMTHVTSISKVIRVVPRQLTVPLTCLRLYDQYGQQVKHSSVDAMPPLFIRMFATI